LKNKTALNIVTGAIILFLAGLLLRQEVVRPLPASTIEIIRLDVYAYQPFEQTKPSDYHWVFTAKKDTLKQKANRLSFVDPKGKEHVIDTSKMKNFEVSTMNLLDNEDILNVRSVHTLG
jgi:hypothetical protein